MYLVRNPIVQYKYNNPIYLYLPYGKVFII